MNRYLLQFIFFVLLSVLLVGIGEEVEASEGLQYTGLIVDASGFDLMPAMSPKIKDTQGNEIYGTMDVGYRIVEEFGIVHYVNSLKEALDLMELVGEHPMIVQAVDGGRDPWKAFPIIDPRDGARILDADRYSDFLKDLRVVFVI